MQPVTWRHCGFVGESEPIFVCVKFPPVLLETGRFLRKPPQEILYGSKSWHHIPHSMTRPHHLVHKGYSCPRAFALARAWVLTDRSLNGHDPLPHLSPCSNTTSSEQPSLTSPSKNSPVTIPLAYFLFLGSTQPRSDLTRLPYRWNVRSMKAGTWPV